IVSVIPPRTWSAASGPSGSDPEPRTPAVPAPPPPFPPRCTRIPAYFRSSCTAGECSARHPPPIIASLFRRSWFPEGFLHHRNQMLHPKWFLDARRPAFCQKCLRIAVRRVAADQYDSRLKFWPVFLDPGVHFRPVHRSWHSNVRNHTREPPIRKPLQPLRPRRRIYHSISLAFERRSQKRDYRRLILDQQDWRAGRLRGLDAHRPGSFAAAAASAPSVATGIRTTNVLPASPSLLQH